MKNKEDDQNLIIDNFSDSFTCNIEPKVLFNNELWVGKVKVPIKTEIDFSGVHESQHEKILKLAQQIYDKDRKVGVL